MNHEVREGWRDGGYISACPFRDTFIRTHSVQPRKCYWFFFPACSANISTSRRNRRSSQKVTADRKMVSKVDFEFRYNSFKWRLPHRSLLHPLFSNQASAKVTLFGPWYGNCFRHQLSKNSEFLSYFLAVQLSWQTTATDRVLKEQYQRK